MKLYVCGTTGNPRNLPEASIWFRNMEYRDYHEEVDATTEIFPHSLNQYKVKSNPHISVRSAKPKTWATQHRSLQRLRLELMDVMIPPVSPKLIGA